MVASGGMMGDGEDDDEEDGEGEGGVPPGATVIRLTEEENAAVERVRHDTRLAVALPPLSRFPAFPLLCLRVPHVCVFVCV